MPRQFARTKQPLIDVLLAAGLDARPRDPYFDDAPDDWRWHASQLANCPRQLMLTRAGLATDPTPLNGRCTMELGTYFHTLAEQGAQALANGDVAEDQRLPLIGTELGGPHPTLPLSARADLVLGERDDALIYEIKAEGAYAFTGRRQDARRANATTAARPEHRLQVAGQAETLEARGDVERVTDGIIVYLNRDTGERDEQVCAIDDRWRTSVTLRVNGLETAWHVYTGYGKLPPPLPDMDTNWRCRPNSADSPCGRYCRARSACVTLIAEGR